MAQWSRQFSGHTHQTRVEDCEEALRGAGNSFREASAATSLEKARNVRDLAQRLLSARRHLLKSRLLDADGASADRADRRAAEIASLRTRLETLDRGGIDGILEEFSLEDARGAG
jgi:hypothetical protein